MYATSLIRRHICQLPNQVLFATRDLLSYGPRSLVDKVLSNMAKAGHIVRIARGVYKKYSASFQWPTIEEVAKFKANAFCREIVMAGVDAAEKLGLMPKNNSPTEPTYLTNGSTTSFCYRDTRIHFRKAAPRKMILKNKDDGLVIRALQHLGASVDEQIVFKAISSLGRFEYHVLKQRAELMPAWLADVLCRSQWASLLARPHNNVDSNSLILS